ncbi:IS66 family insertion sequence element accessory protein TnpA, partial [Shewanella saliphila]|uniref:IS66 family insertion sequence element accessory protein TnpA n=1 Tax=Shewanella saliphila TaxID=2282698 RepID=UPI001663206E
MKTFRDQQQWQKLILAQQQSGLNISSYCRKHKLSTSSFYAHKKRLTLTESAFVCAQISQHKVTEHQVTQLEFVQPQAAIALEFAKAK